MRFRLETWWHKWRARKARAKKVQIEDGLDCGLMMACVISPRWREADRAYEKHIDWLKENDPAFPSGEDPQTVSRDLCGND